MIAQDRPVRWGIAGTGAMAAQFVDALRQSGEAEIIAIASADAVRAGDAAARLGIATGCRFEELLANPAIDIVYIATLNHLHAEQCIAALSAGKHVLCEKPLATTAADARRIAEAAASSGRFCMEGLWTHFLPAVGKVEQALREGAIGTPRLLSASFAVPVGEDPQGRFFDPAKGGGALLDRGCYLISLALRFCGEVRDVSGRLRCREGVDTSASLTLEFESGALADLTVSFEALGANSMTIAGDAGRLVIQEPICAPVAYRIDPAPAAGEGGGGQGHGLARQILSPLRGTKLYGVARQMHRLHLQQFPFEGNGYVHEVREAHACLRAGRTQSGILPLARSVRVLEIIEAARGS